jgi:ABC-type Zn uptake system ZnuABC Zn-binding protein ZnuA
MIDEAFLRSAINIRRKFLKISNNMDLYYERAKIIVEKLEKILIDIETLQNKIKNEKSVSNEQAIGELLKILNNLEIEGDRLEKLAEPMNKEMETLSKEEHELYRQIKERHQNLTDQDIVDIVQNRLLSEGL